MAGKDFDVMAELRPVGTEFEFSYDDGTILRYRVDAHVEVLECGRARISEQVVCIGIVAGSEIALYMPGVNAGDTL